MCKINSKVSFNLLPMHNDKINTADIDFNLNNIDCISKLLRASFKCSGHIFNGFSKVLWAIYACHAVFHIVAAENE